MSMVDGSARGDALPHAPGPNQPEQASPRAVDVDWAARPVLMRRFTLCEILLVCGAAMAIAGMLVQIHYIGVLQALVAEYGWGRIPRAEVADGVAIDMTTRVLSLVGYTMAIAAFFTGMARVRRVAREVLAARFEYGFGWTVGSLFIPIICLFRPWVGLAEIRGKLASIGDSGSGATWTLAAVFLIGNGVDFVLAMSPKGLATRTADGFASCSQTMFMLFVTMAIAKVITYGALILYLVTLHRPLYRLTRPAQIAECFD